MLFATVVDIVGKFVLSPDSAFIRFASTPFFDAMTEAKPLKASPIVGHHLAAKLKGVGYTVPRLADHTLILHPRQPAAPVIKSPVYWL